MKEFEENRKREQRRKEVLDFARRLSRYLSAQKKSEVLGYEILRNEKEINYFRYRIEDVQKRFDDKKQAVGEIEIQIAKWNDNLADIQPEKEAIEAEYHRLNKIQKDVEQRQALLEKNRSRIRDLTMMIREESEKYDSLNSVLQHDLVRKKELYKDIDAYETRCAKLEEEIGVMTVTKDMLGGKIPESINMEEFLTLEKDNATVEEYAKEVNGAIGKIEKQISEITTEIDRFELEKGSLHSQKDSLVVKLEALESDMSKVEDKGQLASEVDALTQQQNSLSREIRTNDEEIERIESEIIDLDQRLDSERDLESGHKERLAHLTETIQKLDEFEDIEAEFERLENKIRKHRLEVDADSVFLNTIGEAKKHVEAINVSLDAAICDYDRVVNEYKQILLLGYNS